MSSKLDKSVIVAGAGLVAGIFTMLVKKVREAGGTDEDIHRLATPDGENILSEFADLIVGVKCQVDCDADPFCPPDWKVEEHKKGGKIRWTSELVQLYLSEKQKRGVIQGNELRKELKSKPTLNANVLDFLLKNPLLIPEEWKNKAVSFWGTIYRDPGGRLFVRYLYWDGTEWDWVSSWLGGGWHVSCPAVVLASIK